MHFVLVQFSARESPMKTNNLSIKINKTPATISGVNEGSCNFISYKCGPFVLYGRQYSQQEVVFKNEARDIIGHA